MGYWPMDRRFMVREDATKLVHVAQSYDNGYIAPLVEHATWCNLSVDRRFFTLLDDDDHPTCLLCVGETFYYADKQT